MTTKYVVTVDDGERRFDIKAERILDAWEKAIKLLKKGDYPPNKIEIEDVEFYNLHHPNNRR